MKLNIEIDVHSCKHLPEISSYNYNYYKIETSSYDYILNDNIILEEYDECSNSFTLSFGHFENDIFRISISWTTYGQSPFDDI